MDDRKGLFEASPVGAGVHSGEGSPEVALRTLSVGKGSVSLEDVSRYSRRRAADSCTTRQMFVPSAD